MDQIPGERVTASNSAPPRPTKRESNGPITLVTPTRRFGTLWLRFQFLITRVLPELMGLAPFKSVFFSNWNIIAAFPYNGAPQVKERPTHPYLLWEVAYSAEVDPYIEEFAIGIHANLNRIWRTAYGFPGTDSIAELTKYITTLQFDIGHMYWAYPDATVRMILSALEVAKEHAFLLAVAETGDAAEFARTYQGFLIRRGAEL